LCQAGILTPTNCSGASGADGFLAFRGGTMTDMNGYSAGSVSVPTGIVVRPGTTLCIITGHLMAELQGSAGVT
jgi:hypothetical protein